MILVFLKFEKCRSCLKSSLNKQKNGFLFCAGKKKGKVPESESRYRKVLDSFSQYTILRWVCTVGQTQVVFRHLIIHFSMWERCEPTTGRVLVCPDSWLFWTKVGGCDCWSYHSTIYFLGLNKEHFSPSPFLGVVCVLHAVLCCSVFQHQPSR